MGPLVIPVRLGKPQVVQILSVEHAHRRMQPASHPSARAQTPTEIIARQHFPAFPSLTPGTGHDRITSIRLSAGHTLPMLAPCKHTVVRIVSREEDAEYVECQACGDIFDSIEYEDMEREEKAAQEAAEMDPEG